MTREEAIRELKSDYCGNRIICELYPDQCNREDCEIWWAIKALQAQDKLQDIEYMCRLSGGADYFNAFRAISEKVKNTTTFLNNLNDGVENSTATQSNGIESKVKGMTACRVPDAPTNAPTNAPTKTDAPTNTPTGTISRQAAIDAIEEMQIPIMRSEFPEEQFVFKGMSEALQAIKDLPSAQPDLSSYSDKLWRSAYERGKAEAQAEIIRCRDCKHWKNKHLCESLSRYGSFETKADFYCGYAERKTDEQTD